MAGLVPAIHESDSAAMRGAWVYITTNRPNGTLYVGVTNDFARRAHEHREGLVDGFHPTVRAEAPRLVRGAPDDRQRHPAREGNEALAADVEGAVDPQREPGVGRPLRRGRLCAAAATLRPAPKKTWMAGTSPAMTG